MDSTPDPLFADLSWKKFMVSMTIRPWDSLKIRLVSKMNRKMISINTINLTQDNQSGAHPKMRYFVLNRGALANETAGLSFIFRGVHLSAQQRVRVNEPLREGHELSAPKRAGEKRFQNIKKMIDTTGEPLVNSHAVTENHHAGITQW
jgi:hypothetical protein